MARADVLLEREGLTCGVHAFLGEIEVASPGDLVGEERDRLESEVLHHPCSERVVELVEGVVLDEECAVGEEREILHILWVVKVDQDGDPLSAFRMEDRSQEASDVEVREGPTTVSVFQMGHGGLNGFCCCVHGFVLCCVAHHRVTVDWSDVKGEFWLHLRLVEADDGRVICVASEDLSEACLAEVEYRTDVLFHEQRMDDLASGSP